MTRAIFVSLSHSYPELDLANINSIESEALKNCTCGWWKINIKKAKGVEYVLGVDTGGQVVSVYRVTKGKKASNWPSIKKWPREDGKGFENRKYIPTNRVTPSEWGMPSTWNVRMYGPIQYGTVHENPKGTLASTDPVLDKHDVAP